MLTDEMDGTTRVTALGKFSYNGRHQKHRRYIVGEGSAPPKTRLLTTRSSGGSGREPATTAVKNKELVATLAAGTLL